MIRTLVACLAFAFAPAAWAQQGVEGAFYLGGGVAAALESFDLPSGVDVDEGFTLSVLGGYQFNRTFSLEGEFELLDNAFELDTSVPGLTSGDVDGFAYTLNGKIVPFAITDSIRPFVKLGLGILDIVVFGDDQESEVMYQAALGAEFDIAQNTLLEFQGRYHMPQDSLKDFKYWTVGLNLVYQFR